MRQYIRNMMTLAALLLMSAGVWAASQVTITKNDQSSSCNYQTGVDEDQQTICTLTITPSAGKYITSEYIKVIKVLSGNLAQTPRRAPGLEDETIAVTAVDPTADPSGEAQYWFYMPEDENYDVEVTLTFQNRESIADANVLLSPTSFTYNGSEHTPEVTVKLGEEGNEATTGGPQSSVVTLIANTDYTVEYEDNVEAGEATVIVTGRGQYTGSATTNFTIDKADLETTVTIEAIPDQTFTGESIKPAVNLTFNDEPLSEEEYTIGYSDNENHGVATVTLTATEKNFTGTKSATFIIVPRVYGLTVNGVGVQSDNRTEILGEGNTSIQFDGIKTLFLENANLTSLVVTGMDELTIYLKGTDNTINGAKGVISTTVVDQLPKLEFATKADESGALTYTLSSGAWTGESEVFEGFDVTYKNNLALTLNADKNAATVRIPMSTIINNDTEENKTTEINYGVDPNFNAGTQVNNVTIGNVLYTLADNGTMGSSDGYDQTTGQVVMNSTMTDEAVTTLTVIPGTDEYAMAFQGITFMVPAGTGYIKIYAETDENHEFHLLIEGQEPIIVDTSKWPDSISYVCTADSYVRLYLVQVASPTPMYAQGSHRIGPKSSVGGGLSGLQVTGNVVESPASAAVNAKMLSKSSEAFSAMTMPSAGAGLTISDSEITDIEDGFFSDLGFAAPAAAPRRSAGNTDVPFIDLTGTSIVGKEVDRESGAFKDVPDNTFIYLPAGNTVKDGTKNVVIGSVSEDVELQGTADAKTFNAVKDFTAAKVTFKRSLAAHAKTTVYLPFAISNPDDYGTFYEFDCYNPKNTAVKMRPTTTIVANKAYVLEAQAAMSEIVQTSAQITATPGAQTSFIGTYEKETGKYGFALNEEKYRFVKDSEVAPFCAYVTSPSGAPFITLVWGRPVEISGDVDNSGSITITDAVGIVNDILDNPKEGFDWTLADVNHDSKISITDAVCVVNIILGSPAPKATLEQGQQQTQQSAQKPVEQPVMTDPE